MTHLRYDASTPGGQLAAAASAKLLDVLKDFADLKGLVDAVGNMGGSFSATNFLAANNVVFAVHADDCQAFNDQVTAIHSILQDAATANGGELYGRVYDLFQSD